MRKWALCLAVVMLVALVFTGCNQTPAEETDGTTTTTASTSGGKADVTIKGEVATTTAAADDATTTGDKQTTTGNKQTAAGTTTSGRGAADKGGKTTTTRDDKYKDDAFGNVTTQKVQTKAYTIAAKGSKYATGIKLPKLSKSQAKISYMTNTTWDYIKQESSEKSPTAIYHAMCIWKAVYGVDVEIEMVDWGSFTSYLITSVVAGEAPETFRWVGGRPKWIQNSLVTTLEDKLDLTDKDYDVDAMQDASAMYGHLYAAFSQGMGMPGGTVIAYNKTKFEEAGEPDPMTLYKQGKWTWTQFVKTADNMTDAANNEYGVTGTGAYYPTAFGMMTMNDDATITNNIKSPTFVKCMQAVWKLYREENAARRADDGRSTFPLGQDAMYPITMKEYTRMMDTAKANGTTDEFGVVPNPVYDFLGHKNPVGRKSSNVLEGFSISSCPKNMEGAIEFVRLVTKVGTNISKTSGEFGWATGYLSAEEKDVFRKVKYTTPEWGGISFDIDGTNEPLNNTLKYPVYLSENVTQELASVLASAYSAFEGVINEYEVSAGLRK